VRLARLELHGFKSFADSTEMVFESGVTAIVGPNGCGKSNVSDAVRWVLGEQRARLLRGAKMEEVIFQGSSARRPVNVAEVSLVFENDGGELPMPFQEVVITRRLSRSGESEYFLNRAPCRLRDISDMLRGTGLGSDAGVVIEAKMIDALLSDRPDDRRELFEEAAGVGLYRDRRRTTERRLEETTVDLQRLDDLIGEVQSQVRSLSRQRKRAERYSELMARRFTVDIALAVRETHAWSEELTRLEGRLVELRDEVPNLDNGIVAAERARDDAQGNRAAAEAQRAELTRLVTTLRENAQEIRSEMAVAGERQRNTIERRQRAEAEATESESYRSRLAADREQATSERARQDEQLRAARAELDRHQQAEDQTRLAVSAARSALDTVEARVREVQDRQRRAEIDRERGHRDLDELMQQVGQLDTERAQLTDALTAILRERDEADVERGRADERIASAAEGVDRARANDRATRDREASARADLFRADEALASLQGKVNALESLERERVGLAPSAARLLRDRERFGEGAVLGPLSDFISANQAGALLVERFLGATVHAVLVRDRETAESVRAWHAETNPGPLLLLPLDATALDRDADDTGALAALIDAAPAARRWVNSLLGGAHTVDDGAAFVDSRGAIWLPGSMAGPGPLRRRAELFEHKAQMATLEETRRQASATADELRAALVVTEAEVVAASAAHEERQVEGRRAAERVAEIDRNRQRAERDLREAGALRDRLVARRNELSERVGQLELDITSSTDALRDHDAQHAAARDALVEAERRQEDAREQRTRWQVEEAQIQARVQVAADRERRLDEEAANATARLDILQSELTDLSQADSSLAEQIGTWQFDLDAREAMLADGELRLLTAEDSVRLADEALTAAAHSVDDLRRQSSARSEELHTTELRVTELGGRRAAIRERLETEWKRPLDDMLSAAQAVELDDDALRAEADDLRAQVEALGPVNVLAIEEHEETLKRSEFLTAQRTDLTDARHSLLQAIREIDTTARELFLTTFTQVREHFRQIFMTLFGGGECDLRLENPDTPLDCDIEIHASPRGKRTQRINLLSSGERALVALSLLFGIFLTKPSPFCLLDEVDAPLDDANIGRFVRMLNQFKSRTQFIVITHNPRTTTEAADAVYGVTMQEPGVSSLVSVRVRGAATVDGAA
jgi:chromosome segregation protein